MEEKESQSLPQNSSEIQPTPRSSPKGILIFLLAVVILGSGGAFALQQNQEQKDSPKNQDLTSKTGEYTTTTSFSPISSHTLVYGAWSGDGSIIKALDLSSGDITPIAKLPINIKKVSVLSSDTLLYIDQTDARDYGKQLTLYSLKDKKSTLAVKAEAGYGIDDYVISPDKKNIATWEVSIPARASALSQGTSRVYTASLADPTKKNLIYDEKADKPVHYPLAILNDGKVLLDTFQANDPNGGTGWAYGMSVANFDGSVKQDLTQMANGTYGTQPSLSDDGTMLVFAGYDGSNGPGTAIKNDYRQAILTPNTVETLDTATLARTKIADFSNKNIYPSLEWDKNGKVLVTAVGEDLNYGGDFAYDPISRELNKITLSSDQSSDITALITTLSPGKILVGKTDNSDSTLANLGEKYSSSYKAVSVNDYNNKSPQQLNLPDQLIQKITFLPSNYFPTTNETTNLSAVQTSKDSVQLDTFYVKTDLDQKRTGQQGSPRCRNLQTAQCDAKGLRMNTQAYANCVKATGARSKGKCHDSPLYLYGPMGQKVTATIHTPVSSSVPSYDKGYRATLLGDGKFQIDGKTYSEITYDYTPALKRILPPTYGAFAAKEDVAKVITDYAKKLGLNEAETQDLVTAGKQKITSPYAFISFFDQKTSEAILPISFNPKPDNYLNVVFYFKLLEDKPNFSPVPPSFGAPLKRTGFTAVEVSELVD